MSASSPSRVALALAALWMVAMTARLYPQFKDTVRVDGRLTTIAQFLEDSCGQRIGPAAVTCLAESGEQAQLLLRQEQGKSVLLIMAPLLGWGLICFPARLVRVRLARRAG
jgi:hypothetical protein